MATETKTVMENGVVRNATPAEIAEIEARAAEPTLEERINAIQQVKESAKAKLAALGLTEEEVNAIIGGV